MNELVFRCPYTNKRLSSGIEIDRDNGRHFHELPLRVQCCDDPCRLRPRCLRLR
jgi:hypothetical protein